MKTEIVFCLVSLMVINSAMAAKKVDAEKRSLETKAKRQYFTGKRGYLGQRNMKVRDFLDVNPETDMEVKYTASSAQGTTVEKLRETYKGIPVFDSLVAIERDEKGVLTGTSSGVFFEDIEEDLPDPSPAISTQEALNIALASNSDLNARKDLRTFTADHFIFIDETSTARSAYLVNYVLDNGVNPARKTVVVDARNLHVIKKWTNFQTFNCGPRKIYKAFGGNEKMGKIIYGNEPYCLTPTFDGQYCVLENKYVKVLDMRPQGNSSAARFKCKNAYDDEVNGAYSPAIDAFFFGSKMGEMFERYFHSTPLPSKMILRVHYGTNYENAFWDGEFCTFGDGQNRFYPMTSMDVVGHEVAHGVTEFASGLIYNGQSGGLNEAFSDIIGETLETYIRDQYDMRSGDDIGKDGPLRYYKNPPEDGSSIRHVNDFYDGIDVHYSSGVINRVFYVLLEQKNGDIFQVANAFLHANRIYWHESTDYQEAGCGLLKSAYDLGQNPTPYLRALNDVGINSCEIDNHIRHLRDNQPISNLQVSDGIRPMFGYQPDDNVDDVTVTATSASGPVSITVRFGTWLNDLEEIIMGAGQVLTGVDSLDISDMMLREVMFIELSSEEELSDVTIRVSNTETKRFLHWY